MGNITVFFKSTLFNILFKKKKWWSICLHLLYGLVDSVKENFEVLDDVKTDSKKEIPSQQYWVFKHQFTAEEAQLWCLKRKL